MEIPAHIMQQRPNPQPAQPAPPPKATAKQIDDHLVKLYGHDANLLQLARIQTKYQEKWMQVKHVHSIGIGARWGNINDLNRETVYQVLPKKDVDEKENAIQLKKNLFILFYFTLFSFSTSIFFFF